jgi:hypothetical protein
MLSVDAFQPGDVPDVPIPSEIAPACELSEET